MDDLSTYLKTEEERRKDFYGTITEQEKAEFINGEVVYHSPVIRKHNQVTGNLYAILKVFVATKELGFVGIEKC